MGGKCERSVLWLMVRREVGLFRIPNYSSRLEGFKSFRQSFGIEVELIMVMSFPMLSALL